MNNLIIALILFTLGTYLISVEIWKIDSKPKLIMGYKSITLKDTSLEEHDGHLLIKGRPSKHKVGCPLWWPDETYRINTPLKCNCKEVKDEQEKKGI